MVNLDCKHTLHIHKLQKPQISSRVMICEFVGVRGGLWHELADLNHTRITYFSSVLIDREVRRGAKLNADELRDQDTRQTCLAG